MAVTPVRTSYPRMIVECPTVTPATSEMASNGPAGRMPTFSPKSAERGWVFGGVLWPNAANAIKRSEATMKIFWNGATQRTRMRISFIMARCYHLDGACCHPVMLMPDQHSFGLGTVDRSSVFSRSKFRIIASLTDHGPREHALASGQRTFGVS